MESEENIMDVISDDQPILSIVKELVETTLKDVDGKREETRSPKSKLAIDKIVLNQSSTICDEQMELEEPTNDQPILSVVKELVETTLKNAEEEREETGLPKLKNLKLSDNKIELNQSSTTCDEQMELEEPTIDQIILPIVEELVERTCTNTDEEREETGLPKLENSKLFDDDCFIIDYFHPKHNPLEMESEKLAKSPKTDTECDCCTVGCVGCFFPCETCLSTKCGVYCRVGRKWNYRLSRNQ